MLRKTAYTIVALCVLALCGVAIADAWTRDEQALGRLTTHEAGFARWRAPNNDHAAIAAIIKRRAYRNHRTVAEDIERLHTQHMRETHWVYGLDDSFQRPPNWPEERVHWEPTGIRQWTRTLELARWNLDDEAEDPCHGRADTWMARETPRMSERMKLRIRARREAMLAAGHTPVDCGDTFNEFWHYGQQ